MDLDRPDDNSNMVTLLSNQERAEEHEVTVMNPAWTKYQLQCILAV